MRIILSLTSLILILGIFAVNESRAQAQGPLGQILERMDGHNKGLSSLKADVIMTKKDFALKVEDIIYGNTSYLPKTNSRNMYIRLDWTSPQQEQMVVVGDQYTVFRPKLNQILKGSTKNAKGSGTAGNAFAFISMSRAEMKKNYDVVYLGPEQINKGSVNTIHLQLTPKAKTSYKQADLWVDSDGMPRLATVTELNNDTTSIFLENIKKNIKLNENVFAINAPNAKVVKN